MRFDPNSSRLVLVDYQARLMPVISDGDGVVARGVKLGQVAWLLGIEVIGTEQNPQGLGPNVETIRSVCTQTFSKMSFGAFREEDIKRWLIASPKKQLVLAGCESHVCLTQTALGALELGFQVGVVEDASGSRRSGDKFAAMNRLRDLGVQVLTTEMIAFEWLGSCESAKFKAVLKLLK